MPNERERIEHLMSLEEEGSAEWTRLWRKLGSLPPSAGVLAEELRKHAEKLADYQTNAWDVIVEAWTDEEIEEAILRLGSPTWEEVLAHFETLVEVWYDRRI